MAGKHSIDLGRSSDLTGQRFTFLVALKAVTREGRSVVWLCRCDCGKKHLVRAGNLVNRSTKSCGCARRRLIGDAVRKHGGCPKRAPTPEYRVWSSMLNRCRNPRVQGYSRYGGRGIKVCDRWLGRHEGFKNFLADMGPRPGPGYTLERIDNDGNYEPENCRWATMLEQDNNKRNNVFYTWEGERLTMSQWARKMGIRYSALKRRFSAGWSIERALTTPVETKYHPRASCKA